MYQAILDRPGVSLVAVLAVTFALAFGITRLELKTDGAEIYPLNNKVITQTDIDREDFHDPQGVVCLVTTRDETVSLESPQGFRFIKEITASLRSLNGVRSDGVKSLATLLDVETNLETMSIRGWLDSIPDNAQKFDSLVVSLRRYPFTSGLYLSPSGRAAALYVPPAVNVERTEFVRALQSWINHRSGDPFRLRLTGPLVAEVTLGEIVLHDLAWLIPVMLVVIAIVLFLFLKSIAGVIIPLVESLLVLVWTLGLMGWCGVPVTLVTTVLPVILMTMAITDEIHLLERFSACLGEDQTHSIRAALLRALREVGKPIVGTSLTTSLGFLSFLSASVGPLRHFGLFTAFGILVAMVLSFTAIPAVLVLIPRSWLVRRRVFGRTGFHPVDQPSRPSRVGRSRLLPIIGLLLLILCGPGLFRLSVQDSWVDNFDPSSALVTAEKKFNDNFWGSYRFDVIFDGPNEFFYSPKGAALIEQFTKRSLAGPNVGGVISYLTPFSEVARGLGLIDTLSKLPERGLSDIATLAEMTEDRSSMLQLISGDGSSVRLSVMVNSADYRRSQALYKYLSGVVEGSNIPDDVMVHFSGDIPVALEVVKAVVSNQLRSIFWTLVGVGLLLIGFFTRGLAALVVLVPVVAAGFVLFSVMGYVGMPLGIATSIFASLTIGVGIDYALHFYHNYRRERRNGRDHQSAIDLTMYSTGRAIRWNALVLAIGFLVLAISAIKPNQSLGILLSSAMLASWGATLLFLPPLLKRLSFGLLILCLIWPGNVSALQQVDSVTSTVTPFDVLRMVEVDYRRNPRVVSMDFTTTYQRRKFRPVKRAMWSLINGDTLATRLLHVVTEPPRLAGTVLLYRDNLGGNQADSMWIYLSILKRKLRLLNNRSQKAYVPGTALTYEDSRGFIPAERYELKFRNGSKGTDSIVTIEADVRTAEEKENLGFNGLFLEVDTFRKIITRIDYLDDRCDTIKTYELLKGVQVAKAFYPGKVRIEQLKNGYTTIVDYKIWLLDRQPYSDLFDPRKGGRDSLKMLSEFLTRNSIPHDTLR